ncbi:MAG TPA: DUF308 domain-containing protein [Aldersonia sp.]
MTNRPMPRSLSRLAALPWWASILVGAVCVGLGLYLLTRPLMSLTTLAVLIGLACLASGVADLIAATRSATPRAGVLAAVVWIVLGLVVLVWLGYTIDLLAPVAAIALAISGVIRLLRTIRGGTVDERIATALFGIADLVFAVVAWRRPDVTRVTSPRFRTTSASDTENYETCRPPARRAAGCHRSPAGR